MTTRVQGRDQASHPSRQSTSAYDDGHCDIVFVASMRHRELDAMADYVRQAGCKMATAIMSTTGAQWYGPDGNPCQQPKRARRAIAVTYYGRDLCPAHAASVTGRSRVEIGREVDVAIELGRDCDMTALHRARMDDREAPCECRYKEVKHTEYQKVVDVLAELERSGASGDHGEPTWVGPPWNAIGTEIGAELVKALMKDGTMEEICARIRAMLVGRVYRGAGRGEYKETARLLGMSRNSVSKIIRGKL